MFYRLSRRWSAVDSYINPLRMVLVLNQRFHIPEQQEAGGIRIARQVEDIPDMNLRDD
jgi:hypothetical protein